MSDIPASDLLQAFHPSGTRPRIFVSCHGADRVYCQLLNRLYADRQEIIHDGSSGPVADELDYERRRIRNERLRETGCTIVLCGAQTASMKQVDRDIEATLGMGHGLVGIGVPSARSNVVPDRLAESIRRGHAVWIADWHSLTSASFAAAITDARTRAEARCNHYAA